jgi:hypothetical protein
VPDAAEGFREFVDTHSRELLRADPALDGLLTEEVTP